MNTDTQQWIYRVIASTLCLTIVIGIAGMYASAWHFGDGEAVKIIDSMTTPLLSAIGAMVAFILGHFSSAVVASIQAGKTAQITAAQPPAPAPVPVAMYATPQPQPQPQSQPQQAAQPAPDMTLAGVAASVI